MAALYTLSKKRSPSPVLTWNKAFFTVLKQARPESVSLMLAKLFKDLSDLGLPNVRVQYEQLQELERDTFHLDTRGMWTSKYSAMDFVHFRIQRCFVDGVMVMRGVTPDELLRIAEAFYAMLDTMRVEPVPAPSASPAL